MEKNTGKVREICQSENVGTMLDQRHNMFLKSHPTPDTA